MDANADLNSHADQPGRDDAAAQPKPPIDNTGGNTYVKRDQNTINGDINNSQVNIGSTVINKEDAYNVTGLPNPYLGLRSFRYDDQKLYAGREHEVAQAIEILTTPGTERTLLFVTGASGSGKSSFVQAGMLPTLVDHFQKRHRRLRHAMMVPGSQPFVALADAFAQIIPVAISLKPAAMQEHPTWIYKLLKQATPKDTVNIIVIDQFEELFSQTDSTQRTAFFTFLEKLPIFMELCTHLIATLRADYLPELFHQKVLYDMAKTGIDLREMGEEQLKNAIQQPLWSSSSRPEKRFDEALLTRLARDASGDAAYLPLLQMTLENLWRQGSLTAGMYDSLGSAVRERADAVLAYLDYDGARMQPRWHKEQQLMMAILLDLVEVSLDNEGLRDVRHRRSFDELAQGDTLKAELIDEMVQARLLSKRLQRENGEVSIVVVDIIHESLIVNWDRLRAAISKQREVLQQRARFEAALREWQTHRGQPDAYQYLLRGQRLLEAVKLRRCGDIALTGDNANAFLVESEEGPGKTELLLETQFNRAESQRLAFAARELPPEEAETALLLACEAISWHNNVLSEQVLRDCLNAIRWCVKLLDNTPFDRKLFGRNYSYAEYSPRGDHILVLSSDTKNVFLRSADGRPIALLFQGGSKLVKWKFSRVSNRILTLARDGTVRLWDSEGHCLITIASVISSTEDAFSVNHDLSVHADLSSDDKFILTLADGNVRLWNAAGSELPLSLYAPSPISASDTFIEFKRKYPHLHISKFEQEASTFGHTNIITSATFTPDGKYILTVSYDGTMRLWDLSELVCTFPAQEGGICSPDGRRILTRTSGGQLWSMDGTQIAQFPNIHNDAWLYLAFSPDSSRVLVGSSEVTGLWTGDGQSIAILPGADRLGFSPDGACCWILTNSNCQQTLVFDRDGRSIASLSGDQLAFSRDGLMATADGNNIRLWDAKGHQLELLTGHTERVSSLHFSADGQHLLTTQASNGDPRLWGMLKPWPPILGVTGDPPLNGAWYTGGDACVFTVEEASGHLNIWLAEGGQIATLLGTRGSFTPFSSGADGQRLLTVHNNIASLWEQPLGASDDLLAKLLGPEPSPFKPKLIAEMPARTAWLRQDGRRILTESHKGLTLWDEQGEFLAMLSGQPATPPFTPDGHILTYGAISEEGRHMKQRYWESNIEHAVYAIHKEMFYEARLCDQEGSCKTLIPFDVKGGRNKVDAVIISPDGERILFVEEHSIQLYDIPTGWLRNLVNMERLGRLDPFMATYKVEWAVFSPDSEIFLTGSTHPNNKGIKLWDRNGNLLKMLEGSDNLEYKADAIFSPNSQLIAVNMIKDVIIFTREGERRGVLRGHSQQVHSIVFSHDGEQILTASKDHTARLWKVDGSLINIFRGHTAAVKSAVFSYDGRYILTASEDGTARQFVVNVTDLLERAAQCVGRELSEEEIERFFVPKPLHFNFAALGGGYGSNIKSEGRNSF